MKKYFDLEGTWYLLVLAAFVVSCLVFGSTLGGCRNLDPLNPLKNKKNDTSMDQLESLPLATGTANIHVLAEFQGYIYTESGPRLRPAAIDVHHDDDSDNFIAVEEKNAGGPWMIWRVSIDDFTKTKLGEITSGSGQRLSIVAGDSAISALYFQPWGGTVPRRIIFKKQTGWIGTEEISSRTLYAQGMADLLNADGLVCFWDTALVGSWMKSLWNPDGSEVPISPAARSYIDTTKYRGFKIEDAGMMNTIVFETTFRNGWRIERGMLDLGGGIFSIFPAELGNEPSYPPIVRHWWASKKGGRVYWQREDDRKSVFFTALASPSAISSLPLPEEILLEGGSEASGFWGTIPAGGMVFYRPRTGSITPIMPEAGWMFIRPVHEGEYGLWIKHNRWNTFGLSKIE